MKCKQSSSAVCLSQSGLEGLPEKESSLESSQRKYPLYGWWGKSFTNNDSSFWSSEIRPRPLPLQTTTTIIAQRLFRHEDNRPGIMLPPAYTLETTALGCEAPIMRKSGNRGQKHDANNIRKHVSSCCSNTVDLTSVVIKNPPSIINKITALCIVGFYCIVSWIPDPYARACARIVVFPSFVESRTRSRLVFTRFLYRRSYADKQSKILIL